MHRNHQYWLWAQPDTHPPSSCDRWEHRPRHTPDPYLACVRVCSGAVLMARRGVVCADVPSLVAPQKGHYKYALPQEKGNGKGVVSIAFLKRRGTERAVWQWTKEMARRGGNSGAFWGYRRGERTGTMDRGSEDQKGATECTEGSNGPIIGR